MSAVTSDNKICILIVSTNDFATRQLKEGLSALGHEILHEFDGEMALATLKQQPVDVVISSDELIGMNGNHLSQAVARIFPHVPVLVMADHPQPGQIAQILSTGASDVIGNSVSAEEADSIIRRNLERRAAASHRIITDRADVLWKTLRIVAAAIDAKSHYAARHSGRVTQLSLIIGTRLGLSPQDMATLEMAAQLHDIGKIGTPEAVLSKPGALSDEEWVDVLKHPTLGGTFLSTIPELAEIATVVRHHHEHFDGTGYPDGLRKDAIPLLSRIIAVADAYDAMTSERPYRHAMPHAKAVEELDTNSGTQFDPSIVQHLIAALEEQFTERKAA